MGDISQHFNKSEFACKCGCGYVKVDPALLSRLENIRVHFGQPVIINCACRCPKHNKAVGGVPNSQHIAGIAADVVVKGVQPAAVAAWIEKNWPDTGGVGRYATFTHIDTRKAKARWVG